MKARDGSRRGLDTHNHEARTVTRLPFILSAANADAVSRRTSTKLDQYARSTFWGLGAGKRNVRDGTRETQELLYQWMEHADRERLILPFAMQGLAKRRDGRVMIKGSTDRGGQLAVAHLHQLVQAFLRRLSPTTGFGLMPGESAKRSPVKWASGKLE